jgi:hypothetical protein
MGSPKAKVPEPNPTADYNQYLAEGSNALRAQDQLLRQQIGYEAGLQPLLTAQQMASLKGEAQGMLGLYGDLYAPAQKLQSRYAADQLSMMSGLGAQATGAALGSLDATTRNIYDTFGQQALSDLQAGTSLNAQETTQAQQAARAAASASGMTFSRQGIDLEILNTYNMGQRRLAQRQATAQQAYQMGVGQQAIGLQGFLTPSFASSQNFGLQGLVQNAQAGYAGLGQSSFLQPESQYLANLRANRLQMETSVAAANAQRSGGIMGGLLGGVGAGLGKAAGAAIFGCWVAREVYGNENPEWKVFRAWLFTESPEWLRDLYLEEGERFAEFIADKPVLKSVVKMAMDVVVKPRLNLLTA